jgi:hypothetical protein
MSGQPRTQSEFALQQVVVLFRDLLSQLEEAGLTHTYSVVFCFCKLRNIDYPVLRYLCIGELPFEEFPAGLLYDGED